MLTQLSLFTRLIADKEYSVAIDRQYSDIENRKVRVLAVRHLDLYANSSR